MNSQRTGFLKKEPMLIVAVLAAVISLFVTPPDRTLLTSIDWKTLALSVQMS